MWGGLEAVRTSPCHVPCLMPCAPHMAFKLNPRLSSQSRLYGIPGLTIKLLWHYSPDSPVCTSLSD